MQENEPDEQFEATDYDENGNIKLPPPPLVIEKPKRLTVAGLKKDLDDLTANIDDDVLGWIGELDVRLGKIEEGSLSDRADVAADIATRLDKIDEFPEIDRLAEITALDHRIDNQDAMIDMIVGELRSHLTDVAATPPEPAAEPEFAQPPQQMAGGTDDINAIAVVASVCQTMTDVLTITRALKEVPELIDAERKEILYIASRASGVIVTPGLQIRAGVKFTGA